MLLIQSLVFEHNDVLHNWKLQEHLNYCPLRKWNQVPYLILFQEEGYLHLWQKHMNIHIITSQKQY